MQTREKKTEQFESQMLHGGGGVEVVNVCRTIRLNSTNSIG